MRKLLKAGLGALLVFAGLFTYFLYPSTARPVRFPDGKQFAFSIIDDTDLTTLERIQPIYGLLEKYGLRTTKTVWVFESNDQSYATNRGETLDDAAYREFILDLHSKGFEIALHGVRGGSSLRADVASGLEEFKDLFGRYPRMHINHSQNRDNLYWGRHRFSTRPYQWLGALTMREFSGEDPQSDYFWGDLAQQRIQYVRQFTFPNVNLLDVYPSIPYRLEDKPYVNYWFPTSNGANLDRFDELLKPENLDRLEREGGVCLVYAHMGAGSFNLDEGGLDPRFEARIRDLTARNGWFAPASDILAYLMKQPGWNGDLGFRDKVRLETLFVSNRILRGVD